jgi:Ser/Thr protein kinase RdoA (MazF antagonist)
VGWDAGDVARRFGLGRATGPSDGPVARGRQGLVWRLETSDGCWAVKAPLRRVSEEAVRLPTALNEKAWAAGVPTPKVRRTEEGTVFAVVGGSQLRVHEWVDLLPPDPLVDPGRVGDLVAALHQVVVEVPGPSHGWNHEPVGAARWDDLVRRLAAARAPFAGRLADLRDELVALESWLEPPRELQACHCDLWADNVLATATGGLCVIDWDNSGPADPHHELGCVLFEFARSDAGRARELVAAYCGAGGPAAVERRGHFTMLIAQLGHITELAACDWLEPNPRSPRRQDAEAWIGEVLYDPHTRVVLDRLLAVARQSSGRQQ